jgi:23S rRNA (pseudouridine1915-N3)-methyltransferase
MKLRICSIGKPKLAYAKLGLEEYGGRLSKYISVELVHLKEGTQLQESTRLLEASEGYLRIALDPRGQIPATEELYKRYSNWELQSKGLAFLIGGADGHTQALRDQSHWIWALSALTFQHELALVVLLEQLYRLQTIRKGEPYNR